MKRDLKYPYTAGVWSLSLEKEDCIGLVVVSRHSRVELARAAARKYAQWQVPTEGYIKSGCGGFAGPGIFDAIWVTSGGEEL